MKNNGPYQPSIVMNSTDDELAALKAENERLKKFIKDNNVTLKITDGLVEENEQLQLENERLKELYTTYVLQCEKLAAEKAELLDALRMAYNLTSFKSPDEDNHLLYILSKHGAK